MSFQSATYLSTHIEHTLVFHRSNGEQLNFAVQHFGVTRQVDLAILSSDPDEPIMKEEINISYQEARLLRDLLNRPEVSSILDMELDSH